MSTLAVIQPVGVPHILSGDDRDTAPADEHADIRSLLARLAPTFNFDRAMSNPSARVIAVRDMGALRGFAVLVDQVMKFYYAGDAATARILMAQFEAPSASRQ